MLFRSPVVHQTDPDFEIGRAIPMRDGKDVCLLSAGNMLPAALETAALLAANDISAKVMSFHTIKPLDETSLANAFANFKLVVTMEEHSILGGLGGSVAEWLSTCATVKAKLIRCGTPDEFLHETAEQEDARESVGLTAAAMAERIKAQL